jgi:hypothetical protein
MAWLFHALVKQGLQHRPVARRSRATAIFSARLVGEKRWHRSFGPLEARVPQPAKAAIA